MIMSVSYGENIASELGRKMLGQRKRDFPFLTTICRFLPYQFQPREPPRRAGQMHGISLHDELTGPDVEALPDDELVLPSTRGDQDLDAPLPQRGVCVTE